MNRTHTIRVEAIPSGRETDYLPACSCSWEGVQTSDAYAAITTACPVLLAEEEGRLRREARLRKQKELGAHAA